jgi:multidrug efflux system membrane fusion protein
MNEHIPSNANAAPPEGSGPTRARGGRFWQHRFRWLIPIILILLIIVIWHIIAHFTKKHAAVRPIPVVVATARVSNVPVYVPALGTVIPTYTVTVRTQVNGILLRVLFREGQLVNSGDLLAEIDPRPFLAQLDQFEGQLARDEAQLENARVDLLRYKNLFPLGAVSNQTYVTQVSLVKQLEGTVAFDKGQIETVKVNLIYCRIVSPVSGRLGLRQVDPGNFIQTTDTNGIVIVNTVTPISVVFPIPEDNVPQVMEQIGLQAETSLLVKAYDRAQNKLIAVGKLLTIDNQINTSTGTVKLKARFDNKDYRLFPNQFVNIQLLVQVLPNQIIIPTAAIQHGTDGDFVYLLNADTKSVSVKPVTVGVIYGNDIVISSGLSAGQAAVIIGTDKLSDGALVTVSYAKEPALAQIPLPVVFPRPPEIPVPLYPPFNQGFYNKLEETRVIPSGAAAVSGKAVTPPARGSVSLPASSVIPIGGVSSLSDIFGGYNFATWGKQSVDMRLQKNNGQIREGCQCIVNYINRLEGYR